MTKDKLLGLIQSSKAKGVDLEALVDNFLAENGPKAKRQKFPDITKDGQVVARYCTWCACYHDVNEVKMVKGAKYCATSYSLWHKLYKDAEAIRAKANANLTAVILTNPSKDELAKAKEAYDHELAKASELDKQKNDRATYAGLNPAYEA